MQKLAASLIIKNAGQLLTMQTAGHVGPRAGKAMSDLGIIPKGAIAVSGGRIIAVDQSSRLLKKIAVSKSTKIIDADGRLVSPGLVDPHSHPVFAGNRAHEFEMRLAGKTYQEIAETGGGIKSTVKATRKAKASQLFDGGKKVLDEMLDWGVTTVEGKSGYGLNTETELKMLRVLGKLNIEHIVDVVVTFLGAHEIPDEYQNQHDDYVALVCGEMIPTVAAQKLAEFCDVFCEKEVFSSRQSRIILQTAQAFGLKIKIHADQFQSTGGAELAAEFGAISADHLDCVGDEGIHLIKKASVIPVLLPGSVFMLGLKKKAPARQMIDYEMPVALGTDFNPGSSPIISLPMAMTLACVEFKMSPAESWSAVTINSAYAVDRGNRIGSITPGKAADIVIWDAEDYREIPYWFGRSLVHRVIKNGKQVG